MRLLLLWLLLEAAVLARPGADECGLLRRGVAQHARRKDVRLVSRRHEWHHQRDLVVGSGGRVAVV